MQHPSSSMFLIDLHLPYFATHANPSATVIVFMQFATRSVLPDPRSESVSYATHARLASPARKKQREHEAMPRTGTTPSHLAPLSSSILLILCVVARPHSPITRCRYGKNVKRKASAVMCAGKAARRGLPLRMEPERMSSSRRAWIRGLCKGGIPDALGFYVGGKEGEWRLSWCTEARSESELGRRKRHSRCGG
jgi:hypothetical protein